jgi:histidinol-phosphate aminotransferase
MGVAEPSYSLYPVLAAIHDTPIVRVPLCDDFSLPSDFAEQLNAAACGLALIVNPHAPSGRLAGLDQLESIARAFRGVLLIDEAYVDFATGDALPLVRQGLPNVLLLRTLSKGYSLAGLRFGYGLGHPDLIAALDKVRDSYNTDVLAQAAAVAAIEHRAQAAETWKRVIAERGRLTQALINLGFSVLPSQSNFVLATPPATGPAAGDLYQSLKERCIFVRYFDQDRLRDKLRITVGTPEQNDALLAALGELGVRG